MLRIFDGFCLLTDGAKSVSVKSIQKPTGARVPEPTKPDPEIAKRALAEAEARRQAAKEAERQAGEKPREVNGAKGPDPARYGDWENKGIASDF